MPAIKSNNNQGENRRIETDKDPASQDADERSEKAEGMPQAHYHRTGFPDNSEDRWHIVEGRKALPPSLPKIFPLSHIRTLEIAPVEHLRDNRFRNRDSRIQIPNG